MSTEQTQSSFTETSPAPGPDGGRASPGLLFCLLPLSSAALGGLTVGGLSFVIAAAAFLSDRAGYGAALSVYGTVITLLPVSIVWAVLRRTRGRLGPDSADMTGIPTSWDRHWVGLTWWTAAMATGWIVIAVLVAGLPDLMSLGSRGGFPALFELLPAGLAALGTTLYVAIASTAVLVIIVPISAGPGRQEPGRGLAKAVYTLFMVEVTLFIAAAVSKMATGRDWYRHPPVDAEFAELLDGLGPDVVHIGHLNHLVHVVGLRRVNNQELQSTLRAGRLKLLPGC